MRRSVLTSFVSPAIEQVDHALEMRALLMDGDGSEDQAALTAPFRPPRFVFGSGAGAGARLRPRPDRLRELLPLARA